MTQTPIFDEIWTRRNPDAGDAPEVLAPPGPLRVAAAAAAGIPIAGPAPWTMTTPVAPSAPVAPPAAAVAVSGRSLPLPAWTVDPTTEFPAIRPVPTTVTVEPVDESDVPVTLEPVDESDTPSWTRPSPRPRPPVAVAALGATAAAGTDRPAPAVTPPPARLSVAAIWVVTLAEQEAAALAHRSLEPEHLLLALVRAGDPVGRLFEDHGVSLAGLRRELGRRTPPGALDTPDGRPAWSVGASVVLATARRRAADEGRGEATSVDLLLALLRPGGAGADLLDAVDVDAAAVIRDLAPDAVAAA